MNDPGLDQDIQDSFKTAEHDIKEQNGGPSGSVKPTGMRAAFRRELQNDEDEEEVGYFQPKYAFKTAFSRANV
jgi:potassium channel subfamily K